MEKVIFIRYSELSLKGKNKKEFIKILNRNIKNKLEGLNFEIKTGHDKVVVNPKSEDITEFIERLKFVVGISWFSVANVVDTTKKDIEQAVIAEVKDGWFKTFRVSAKNISEVFSDSKSLTHYVAGRVLEHTDMKVNLSEYDVEINVRAERNKTTVFGKKIKGIDGLPSGSNGKGLAFLSGGIDSPVAAIKMMTRGLQVDFVTFLSPNVETPELLHKIKKLAKQANKYNGRAGRLYIINFAPVRKFIREDLKKESYRVVFLRRFFTHYGNFLAEKYNYQTLITGDAMGQVASQTPQNLTAVDDASEIFVSRPLIGMDKNSIIKLAREYGTYEISILPGDDMCAQCTPKSPVLSAKMDVVRELAKDLKPAFNTFETIDTDDFTRRIIL